MITKKAYATIADYCEQENANLYEVWTKVECGGGGAEAQAGNL